VGSSMLDGEWMSPTSTRIPRSSHHLQIGHPWTSAEVTTGAPDRPSWTVPSRNAEHWIRAANTKLQTAGSGAGRPITRKWLHRVQRASSCTAHYFGEFVLVGEYLFIVP
jgi:hypothetical protein